MPLFALRRIFDLIAGTSGSGDASDFQIVEDKAKGTIVKGLAELELLPFPAWVRMNRYFEREMCLAARYTIPHSRVRRWHVRGVWSSLYAVLVFLQV